MAEPVMDFDAFHDYRVRSEVAYERAAERATERDEPLEVCYAQELERQLRSVCTEAHILRAQIKSIRNRIIEVIDEEV